MMYRSATVRADATQSLLAVAQGGRLGSSSRCCFKALFRRDRHDRLHLCPRSQAWCQRRKGGSADPCMGRSRGGLTTKIHALVDADGLPVRLELSAGQAADAPMAEKLLSDIKPGSTLLADKAYDNDAIRNFAKQRKCWAISPPKPTANRPPVSVAGYIANAIWWSVSSIASNRGVVWQRDTTDVQIITLPGSNLPRRGSRVS